MPSLESVLDAHTREGELYERLDRGRVRCLACAHRCVILPGVRGICKVRLNRGGVLQVPAGYVSSLNPDPVEKKPLYHVLPGATALTFGMLGCNLHCGFCQNWDISQALRDAEADGRLAEITAEEIVRTARRSGSQLVVSSYNEPLITAEWAAEVFRLAKAEGLKTAFVSNGYASPEVLEYLRPVLDCYKVDLKAMSDRTYRQLGARLQPVLDAIRKAVELGYWVEVVTLVVPGMNDSTEELRAAAEFLVSVSPDVPWHVTAFHPDYRLLDASRTPVTTLLRAAEIGRAVGLRYVYAGNLPGVVGHWEDTACPNCGAILVARRGFYAVRGCRVTSGLCPDCATPIPGIWS